MYNLKFWNTKTQPIATDFSSTHAALDAATSYLAAKNAEWRSKGYKMKYEPWFSIRKGNQTIARYQFTPDGKCVKLAQPHSIGFFELPATS